MSFFNNSSKNDRSYYTILTTKSRYLYMDVDFKWNVMSADIYKQKQMLTIKIMEYLKQFMILYGYKFGIEYLNSNVYIWDATRTNKFSIHIIDAGNVMYYLDIKKFVNCFKYWLSINNKLDTQCNIDNNIYHNNYQLWRLPLCHNGKQTSTLYLINRELCLDEQFKLNFMNHLSTYKKEFVSYNLIIPQRLHINKVKLKQDVNKSFLITEINNKHCIKHQLQNNTSHINSICKRFMININNITQSIKNNELIIRKHYCPIIKRQHRNNTARIKFHEKQLINNKSIAYYVYMCMNQECIDIQQYVYCKYDCCIFKRPWLISEFESIDFSILIELDNFIQKIFENNIITYKTHKNKHIIINTNKIRYNHKDYIMTTFFCSNIIHTKCNRNDISLSCKSTRHKYINYGRICLYCRKCSTFVNFKNNQLLL